MKNIISILLLVLVTSTVSAQLYKGPDNSPILSEYGLGMVPVVGGRVVFEEKFEAPGLSSSQIIERVQAWVDMRFTKPLVLGFHQYDSQKPNLIQFKGEEYFIFKKEAFELDRARIYYYLDIEAEDGKCTMRMSRITYLYNEEDSNGGQIIKAEEWITDDEAFNKKKTRFLKKAKKFRVQTIDLKNQFAKSIKMSLK